MATIPTPSPVTPRASETQAPINHIGRMAGALFSPKPTFEDIARRPSWLAPIVFLTVLSLVFCYVMNQRVDWNSFIRQQAEKNPRFEQLSDDQKQRALGPQTRFAPMFAYIIGALGPTGFALFLTLVFWGAFNLLAGASLRFGTSFGISAHAIMPSAIGSILGMVVMYLKKPGEVDPEHIVASNLGALVSSDAPKWLEKLAASADLFWIWTLLLLATGFSAANPKKIPMSKALGITFGVYVALRLMVVGWAAI